MKGIFLVCLAIGLPLLVASEECNAREFFEFKYKFNKEYDNAFEEHLRCEIFTKKFNEITKRSKLLAAGQNPYEETIYEFSDLTREEFKKQYTGLVRSNETTELFEVRSQLPDSLLKTLPDNWKPMSEELDLRIPEIHIKDQNPCGSCYIFAATGVFEYYLYQKLRSYQDLSEQMSVDCMRKDTCEGGMPHEVFNYFLRKGADYTSVYPYRAREQRCHYLDTNNPKNGVSKSFAKQWHAAPSDEKYLMYLLENVGWVAISISATPIEHYKTGIIPASYCHGEVNHAVILVGYGTDQKTGTPYWIVRNSWGPEWGENGYFRMERGADACEITNDWENGRVFIK
ncbi:hypothetical protein PVAND_010647 [Polypedilum vanderplanki]|uniref:Uncharacterized protein n=1 Tax=Polypedilum vanderplanki TaxID=319348 RepID=A0A9J6CHZ4_POLVA|nr:hypothetical protein PVAND_010647 [Polypedilum vanderplanki]